MIGKDFIITQKISGDVISIFCRVHNGKKLKTVK